MSRLFRDHSENKRLHFYLCPASHTRAKIKTWYLSPKELLCPTNVCRRRLNEDRLKKTTSVLPWSCPTGMKKIIYRVCPQKTCPASQTFVSADQKTTQKKKKRTSVSPLPCPMWVKTKTYRVCPQKELSCHTNVCLSWPKTTLTKERWSYLCPAPRGWRWRPVACPRRSDPAARRPAAASRTRWWPPPGGSPDRRRTRHRAAPAAPRTTCACPEFSARTGSRGRGNPEAPGGGVGWCGTFWWRTRRTAERLRIPALSSSGRPERTWMLSNVAELMTAEEASSARESKAHPHPHPQLNHQPSTNITNQQLQRRDVGYFVSTAWLNVLAWSAKIALNNLLQKGLEEDLC